MDFVFSKLLLLLFGNRLNLDAIVFCHLLFDCRCFHFLLWFLVLVYVCCVYLFIFCDCEVLHSIISISHITCGSKVCSLQQASLQKRTGKHAQYLLNQKVRRAKTRAKLAWESAMAKETLEHKKHRDRGGHQIGKS